MRSHTLALPLAAAALFACNMLPAHATSFASVVVYGDSLSDNGNLYNAVGYPPPPYYNGRFSNGPVAVEQLAAQLGATLTDHAYGGATTGVGNIVDNGSQTTLGAAHLPGIATEFNAFPPPTGDLSSTLFVVWGGADDFESGGSPVTAAQNIDGIVQSLEGDGATHILVPNLPDLGETPEFAGFAPATAYTNAFNATLAADLPAGAILFDTDALLNAILNDPGTYGFNNTTGQCLADLAFPACNGYLFFDDVHPTNAGDTLLADEFAAAVNPTPEPSSLVLLGTGFMTATGLLRRRKSA